MTGTHVIGVDFGTLSGRAVVVRVSDGAELGSGVHEYTHGVMDTELAATGERLPPEWALQVPSDYVDVLKIAVPAAIAASGIDPETVIGIGTDFTASTPLPVLADGTPLCELPDYAGRPHAYVKLWKHHAAQPQADRINALARERAESWLPRYGGFISSEWEFAKGLQLLEEDPELYARMDHWVEAADWIIWQLSGRYLRNACTAGYKGIYQDGAYPSHEFLGALNPDFAGFADDKVAHEIGELGAVAGLLTPEAAAWTGLPVGIAVAVGNVDAHVTAPAARAVESGQMLAIMGTSTCHVMNGDKLAEVPGMCGVVDGGIVAGKFGYEAGQSGVGDIFAWYVENQVPPSYVSEAAERGLGIHEHLAESSATTSRSARTVSSRSTGTAATARCSSTRKRQRAARRADPHHAPGADLPRPHRVDGLRHPPDRRDFQRGGRSGHRVRRGRRAAQEPAADADLQRRAAHADLDDRERAGSGARFGDPRGSRGRRLRRRARGGRGDGQGDERCLPARPRIRRRLRPSLRRVPRTSRLLRPRGQ